MRPGAIERLAVLANEDAWLVHRGRYLDTTFLLGIGDADYLVRIHRGRVEAVDKGPFVQARWTFALRASQAVWDPVSRPPPPPGRPRASASSPSTCRGTASPHRRPTGRRASTSSPRALTWTPSWP